VARRVAAPARDRGGDHRLGRRQSGAARPLLGRHRPCHRELDPHARRLEDPGRTLVYVIVLLTSAVSLLATTMLVRQARSLPPPLAQTVAGLCLAAVALAWAVTHTAFALRYARLYYREDREGIGGIELPGRSDPAYFDFAYFAFTIGMCFQVSDACITSQQIRRVVLLHAVISFAYNSVILAFVLNLVFGMAT